jgi:AraC-like DNA-binding protein
MTLGPFCPSEAPEALDVGVRDGLVKLGHTSDRVIALSDVARVSARSAPIMAEWIAERLGALWTALRESEAPVSVEPANEMFEEGAPSSGRRRAPTPTGPAALIVAAMAADERATARRFMRTTLEEALYAAPAKSFAPVQARAVAVVSQALEAAEKARLSTAGAWAAFPNFAAGSRTAQDIPALSKAAMQVLRLLRRDGRGPEREFQIVLREVDARIDEPIRLDDLAARLGKHPTAITHLFQRRIGLNFSEFVGKLRVEKSKELLRRTQLGVGEVARRVGVRDASNFGRLFRKFEGVSPQQYRDRLHPRP